MSATDDVRRVAYGELDLDALPRESRHEVRRAAIQLLLEELDASVGRHRHRDRSALAGVLNVLCRVPETLACGVAERLSARGWRALCSELRGVAIGGGIARIRTTLASLPGPLRAIAAVTLDSGLRQQLAEGGDANIADVLPISTADVFREAERGLERMNRRSDHNRALLSPAGAAAKASAYAAIAAPPSDAPAHPGPNRPRDENWDPQQHERQAQHILIEVGVPAANARRVLRRITRAQQEATQERRQRAEEGALTGAGAPECVVPETLDMIQRLDTPGYREGARGPRGDDMATRRERAHAELSQCLRDAGVDDSPTTMASLRDRVRQISGCGELRSYQQAASLVHRAHTAGMDKQLRALLQPNISRKDLVAAVDQIDSRTIPTIRNLDVLTGTDPKIVRAARAANQTWYTREFAPVRRAQVVKVLQYRRAHAAHIPDADDGDKDGDETQRDLTPEEWAQLQHTRERR